MQQFISPGSWLCDVTRERYEVREKKSIKKVGLNLHVMFGYPSFSAQASHAKMMPLQ
jgi:hypothetical protein